MDGISEGIGAAQNAAQGAGFGEAAAEAGKFTADLLSGVSGADPVKFAPTELLLYMVSSLLSAVQENSELLMSLAAVCIISTFLAGLARKDGLLAKSAGQAGITAVTVLPAATLFAEVFGIAKTSMSSLEAIGLAVIPAVAVAGKGVGAYGFITCAQIMSILLRYLFLPAIAVYATLSYSETLSSEGFLSGVKDCVKKLFSRGLGIIMMVFSFCSVSSGLMLNATAALSVRTAKYAGSMVPVVGAYLSEAADTVIASASLIKTAGGVCAVMTVVFVGLAPFVKLFAYYCAVNIIAALAGIFTGGLTVGNRIKAVLDITAELTGMVIGLMALMAAFFIINIAVIAR